MHKKNLRSSQQRNEGCLITIRPPWSHPHSCLVSSRLSVQQPCATQVYALVLEIPTDGRIIPARLCLFSLAFSRAALAVCSVSSRTPTLTFLGSLYNRPSAYSSAIQTLLGSFYSIFSYYKDYSTLLSTSEMDRLIYFLWIKTLYHSLASLSKLTVFDPVCSWFKWDQTKTKIVLFAYSFSFLQTL
jgi:hypothetical protein